MKFPIGEQDVEQVAQCFCCQRSDQLVDVCDLRDEQGLTFLTTSVCASCGLILRRRRPTQAWFETSWRLRAEWQASRGGTPFNPKIEEQRYERYQRTASWLKHYGCAGRVIDIGCGPPTGIKAFADAGFSATGLEPDRTRARFALVPEVEVIEATIEQFAPTAQCQFDVVTCQHSLEHFHDPRHVLALITSLAKIDALVFIEVPDFHHSVKDWQDALYLAHHANFVAETLTALAADFGLEPIGREYPPADAPGESHLAIAFRRRAATQARRRERGPTVAHVGKVYAQELPGPIASPLTFVVPYIDDLSLTLKGDPTKIRTTIRENQADRSVRWDDSARAYRVSA